MAQFTLSLCEEVIRTEGKCGLTHNEITQMARLALRSLSVPSETFTPTDDAANAARWRDACMDPAGYAHLFGLLAAGKGTVESLNAMADRIGTSRRAAIAKGLGNVGYAVPLKGAKP